MTCHWHRLCSLDPPTVPQSPSSRCPALRRRKNICSASTVRHPSHNLNYSKFLLHENISCMSNSSYKIITYSQSCTKKLHLVQHDNSMYILYPMYKTIVCSMYSMATFKYSILSHCNTWLSVFNLTNEQKTVYLFDLPKVIISFLNLWLNMQNKYFSYKIVIYKTVYIAFLFTGYRQLLN